MEVGEAGSQAHPWLWSDFDFDATVYYIETLSQKKGQGRRDPNWWPLLMDSPWLRKEIRAKVFEIAF